jgi:hypothetical protein
LPLNIKDPEVYQLARQVANLTGETLTDAVRHSLRERFGETSPNAVSEEYGHIDGLATRSCDFRDRRLFRTALKLGPAMPGLAKLASFVRILPELWNGCLEPKRK